MTNAEHEAIPAPWVLIDDLTVDQAANLLERLTAWLNGPDSAATARAAHALSIGETSDPISIASWAHALAARLRRRAQEAQL